MDWIYLLDLLGTLVFAISGVLTARDKKFDLVGATVIGTVTAFGGGTLRDMMIGRTPVGWLQDANYLYLIALAVVLSYLFGPRIKRLRRSMFVFDTIGIGLFTIIGLEKTLDAGLSIPIAILMGMISATFGGVTRDVLANEVPLIFRKEIYASACLAGGLVFVGLEQVIASHNLTMILSMSVVMLIRYFAVTRRWSLQF